jgi:hypothetical protein
MCTVTIIWLILKLQQMSDGTVQRPVAEDVAFLELSGTIHLHGNLRSGGGRSGGKYMQTAWQAVEYLQDPYP